MNGNFVKWAWITPKTGYGRNGMFLIFFVKRDAIMATRFKTSFHNVHRFLLAAVAVLISICANGGSTNRGVWCWKTPGPYGLDSIIGTNAQENAAVKQFKLWGISHVYGSYGDQLATSKGQAALAAWNGLLYSNGIDSQLLISDDTLGSGDNNVIVEMINFNKNEPAASRCAGVHLDLEPWGLSTWNNGTNYQMLLALAGSYQEVRAELNTNGETNVLVYADQADWLNSLSSINWPSESVCEQWFSDILTNLAGITLMAYDQPTFPRLTNVVEWQMTNFPGVIRVGIDAGKGETWSNLSSFLTVAGEVESNYTDSAGVDIYDFITVQEEVPPMLYFNSAAPLTVNGLNMVIQGPVGSNYTVEASTDLFNWQATTNFLSTSWLTYFTDSAATNYSFRFYQVVMPQH